jgi:amidohydrolase
MNDASQALLKEAQALSEQLKTWRRDLHRHPELAFEEHRTAGMVADHLAALGMEVETGVGHTGVVGLLAGIGGQGPTVLLRFDMDALPIQEETGLSFASQFPGRMHACGHDGHVAIGLGVATLLERHRDRLAGRVKLVFQPAEETANGARAMIEDGVLESPVPDIAFGLHLWSLDPLGHVIVKEGPLWASSDRFDARILGRGSHGALPHQGVDVITVAAYAIAQLQTVVSRSRDPLQPAVLSVGTVTGGSAFNVLAEEVRLSGTLRTFSETTRGTLIEGMHRVLGGVCSAHGAHYELSFKDHTPPLVNDAAAAERLRVIAANVLGPEAVSDGPMRMVAEDMAEFLKRVPGCYFVLGAKKESAGPAEPHHSPRFDIDERALPLGVAVLAGVVMSHLTPS